MVDLGELARGHLKEGRRLTGLGLLVAAGEEFRGAWHLASQAGDAGLVFPALHGLVQVCDLRLDFEGALDWLERAGPWLAAPDVSPADVARALHSRMAILMRLHRADEAARDIPAMAAVLGRVGDPSLLGRIHLTLSAVYATQLAWDLAEGHADIAVRQLDPDRDPEALAEALLHRGGIHLGRQNSALAEHDLRLALQHCRRTDRQAPIYRQLGRLAETAGDEQQGYQYGAQALDCLLHDIVVAARDEVAHVSELLGGLYARAGQRNLALKYLNRSAAYFSQLGLVNDWRRTAERISAALTSPARPTSAPLEAVKGLDFLTALLDVTDELEMIDPYLRGHSERVANLAVIMGRQLGLAGGALRHLNYAGRLHDVGMVAVGAEIVRKPGPLTQAERERLVVHPVIGEEMMRPYGLEADGLHGIRHHHEHWDGRGYPDGLHGEEIPLPARIVAVADVYDALTSDRFYRMARNHEEALELLRQMAGRQLDPTLVDVFVHLHQQD